MYECANMSVCVSKVDLHIYGIVDIWWTVFFGFFSPFLLNWCHLFAHVWRFRRPKPFLYLCKQLAKDSMDHTWTSLFHFIFSCRSCERAEFFLLLLHLSLLIRDLNLSLLLAILWSPWHFNKSGWTEREARLCTSQQYVNGFSCPCGLRSCWSHITLRKTNDIQMMDMVRKPWEPGERLHGRRGSQTFWHWAQDWLKYDFFFCFLSQWPPELKLLF